MAKTITRKNIKLFGRDGVTTNFGRVGSQKAGSPVKTRDIDDIQSLQAWFDGLQNILLPANRVPLKEDFNSILYAKSWFLTYLYQEGIPEWHSGQTYFIGSLCRGPGSADIYQSKIDDNTNNALPAQADNAQWSWFNRPAIAAGLGMENFSSILPFGRWLWQDGAAISRVTFAALLAAITRTATGTLTNGSPTISGVSVDFTSANLKGAPIEGTGIPIGAKIVNLTATTITMSVNATASGGGTALRLLPFGQGDGFSTFNVPDKRGRTPVGGGTGAGLTQRNLGAQLGEENHVLTVAELAQHSHGVSDPGHSHVYPTGVGSPGDNGVPTRDGDGNTPDRSPVTSANGTGISIGNAGLNSPFNVVQPSLVCNFVISY